MTWLGVLADIATIATAVVAVLAYGGYQYKLNKRTRAVEGLLKSKDQPNDNSLLIEQIAGELMLTREQVLEAANRSKFIKGNTGWLGDERRLMYVRNPN